MTPKPEMGRFAYRARYLAGNPLLTTFALHRRDERLFKAVAPEGESTGLIKSFFRFRSTFLGRYAVRAIANDMCP